MSKLKSYFKFLLLILLVPIFYYLEMGFSEFHFDKIAQSLIYTSSVFLSFNLNARKYLLFASLVLLFLMVLFFLIWRIDFANLSGSIGFGMLVIYFIGYVPQLISKGEIE